MSNREFLQLSKVHKNQNIAGWLASSKLDGFRCVWDGGVSRGDLKSRVPWANTNKDERYQEAPRATGLWSRYGNVVHAPDWFLDQLPRGVVLDGEMHNAYLSRQKIRSICARLTPDQEDWKQVALKVFSRLSPDVWLGAGRINNPNFVEKHICGLSLEYFLQNGGKPFGEYTASQIQSHLSKQEYWHTHLQHVKQVRLPNIKEAADTMLLQLLETEMDKEHGEGLILVDPNSFFQPKRVAQSLKVKPRDDSEAKIIGYTAGKEGKLLGLMGNVIVTWKGKVFELSGFTDAERETSDPAWCAQNPGKQLHADMSAPAFPIGYTIGFTYRGLTDEGTPNEAVYCRKEGCYS